MIGDELRTRRDERPDAVPNAPPPPTPAKRRRAKRWSLWVGLGLSIIAILTVAGWFVFLRQPPANANPFTATDIAVNHFPIYYPLRLPAGYRIDPKSVTEPQAGVVVFTMRGPKGEKLYMSQEARPTKYGVGNFYNSFSDLKEVPVSDGAIAVGHLGNGAIEVVSRANSTTWLISNTKAHIPFDELITMMRNLQLAD